MYRIIASSWRFSTHIIILRGHKLFSIFFQRKTNVPRWISIRSWRPWGLRLLYLSFWCAFSRGCRQNPAILWCITRTGSWRVWIHGRVGPGPGTRLLGSRRLCLLRSRMLLTCLDWILLCTLFLWALVSVFVSLSLFSSFILSVWFRFRGFCFLAHYCFFFLFGVILSSSFVLVLYRLFK